MVQLEDDLLPVDCVVEFVNALHKNLHVPSLLTLVTLTYNIYCSKFMKQSQNATVDYYPKMFPSPKLFLIITPIVLIYSI